MVDLKPETKSKSAFADTRTTIKSLSGAIGIGLALGLVVACVQAARHNDMRSIYVGLDGLLWLIVIAVLSLIAVGVTIAVVRPRMRTVVVIAGIVVIFVAVFRSLVRIDSFYGNMVPRLAWRWQPSAESEFHRYKSSVTPVAPGAIENVTPPTTIVKTGRDHPGFLGQHRNGTVAGVSLEPNCKLA